MQTHEQAPLAAETRSVVEQQFLADWTSRLERVDYILSGEQNFGRLMQKVTDDHTKEILTVYYGSKPEHQMRKTVLGVEGLPGVGKTRLVKEVMQYLDAYSSRMEQTLGTPVHRYLLHWDSMEEEVQTEEYRQNIEQKARVVGNHQQDYQRLLEKLQTIPPPEPGKAYPDVFETMVNDELCLRLAELLERNEPNMFIVIDKPGGTGIKVRGGWEIKRQYGVEDIDNLVNRHGVFYNIARDAYYLATVGIVASPWQRVGMTTYRTQLNQPQTDLSHANILNTLYNQQHFPSEEAFRNAQGGGSDEQVENAYMKAMEVIDIMLQEAVWLPPFIRRILQTGQIPENIPTNDPVALELITIAQRTEEVWGISKEHTMLQGAIGTAVAVILENTFGVGAGSRIKEDSFFALLAAPHLQPDVSGIYNNNPRPHFVFPGIFGQR